MAAGLKRAAGGCAVLLLAGCATVATVTQNVMPHGDVYQLSNDAQNAYNSGDDARAERLYIGLARAAPNDPEIWFRLGNLYARADKPDAAAEAYRHSLALNRNDARVWYNLGLIRLRQGWASMIAADHLTREDDPLHAEAARVVGALDAFSDAGLKGAPAAAPVTMAAPEAGSEQPVPVIPPPAEAKPGVQPGSQPGVQP